MDVAASLRSCSPGLPWRWWLVGGALVVIYAVQDLLLSSGGVIAGEVYWGRDFINLWTGGRIVREDHLSILYDLPAYAAYQQQLFGEVGVHNYSYPPVTFPIAAAFSWLPYPLALAAWLSATGVLFLYAARQWWPRMAGPLWLGLLTPAALMNIWTGHYGFLLGALFLLGWQKLDEHPRQAGIFFGLMLIKPHLAVLAPLVLLIRRDWQAIASAAATVCLLVGLTVLSYGWQPWHDFLFKTSGVQASLIDAGSAFFGLMSCSTATAMLRLGASWPVALAVQAMVALAAVAMVTGAAVRRVPTRDLAFLVATATFLVLPYSFSYDLTVVAIGALVVLFRTDAVDLDRRLALYGFLSAQLGILLAGLGLPGLPLMLAGLAASQFRLALPHRAPALGQRRLALFGERAAAQ